MKFIIGFFIFLISYSVIAENFNFDEYERYRNRTSETSDKYIEMANASIFKDKEFLSNCWSTNEIDMFYLYYTVSLDGEASDIKWYPRVSNSDCIEAKVKAHTFPKPTVISCVQLTLWDDG